MKQRGLLAIITVFVSCWVSPGNADDPQELVFTTIEDVPATGAAVDILAQAYKHMGYDIRTLEVPSSRALMLANRGIVDGDLFRVAEVASDYPNLIKVPTPLMTGQLRAVTLNPALKQWDKEQLGHQRIGVRRGVLVAEMTAEGMNVMLVDKYVQILRLLEAGRIEVALISDIEGSSPLHTPDWSHVYLLEQPVRHFTLHHYLNRKHAHLIEPLSQSLQQILDERERSLEAEEPAISPLLPL